MHLRSTLTVTFFPGKPEGADGEDMETGSHVDAQVSHSTFCQIIVLFFGLLFLWREQVSSTLSLTYLTTDG